MGKKSLLSSTSKKKGDSKSDEGKEKKTRVTTGAVKKAGKTAPRKKIPAGSAAIKKATPKKAAPKKKAVPEKKAAPKNKAAAKSASKAKSSIKPKDKKAAAKKRPVSIKDLLSKKFGISVPEKQYTPPEGMDRRAEISSPSIVVGTTPEETERIRRLLFKKFDMASSKTAQDQAPKKPAGDISPPAVSISAKDDDSIDTPAYPSIALEGAIPVKKMDSTLKAALIGIIGLVVLMGLIVGASMKNTAKYYLKPGKGELEVWKGKFSPMGKKKFATLSATPMPAAPKSVYGKNEIFPFIFESYINQADALLNASDLPDFELIKRTLTRAKAFAVTPELNDVIQRRLSKINLMTLVYKADILAGKDTIEDLASARDALEKAMRLNLDEAERGLVNQKLQWIDERQAQLKQMEAEAEEVESTGIDKQ